MTQFDVGDARVYDSTVRDFISSKHQQLAEILHDYRAEWRDADGTVV